MWELPEKTFERNMNHNYLVLRKQSFFEQQVHGNQDYRVKMVLENQIQGLLPISHRMTDAESRYYYEINSLQALDRMFERSEIDFKQLYAILSGCGRLFGRLEEYLLDGTQIILQPEFIYIKIETGEPCFTFYPEYQGDIRAAYVNFLDYILTKIDHTDEKAVMLAYQVYKYTRNSNYVLGEIDKMLQLYNCNMKNTLSAVPKMPQAADTFAAEEKPQPVCQHIDNNNEKPKQDKEEILQEQRNSFENIRDILAAGICAAIALCASGLIFCEKGLGICDLSSRQELYLCGAAGMSLMASVLFLISAYKKNRSIQEIKEIERRSREEAEEKAPYIPLEAAVIQNQMPKQDSFFESPVKESVCGETVYMGVETPEYRVLKGNVNGNQIKLPLRHFPIILGKLSDFVDYVIDDNTVSKMHARLEEREGIVYISDMNSTNGTIKNGVLIGINEAVPLKPGDELRLGRICLTYA